MSNLSILHVLKPYCELVYSFDTGIRIFAFVVSYTHSPIKLKEDLFVCISVLIYDPKIRHRDIGNVWDSTAYHRRY